MLLDATSKNFDNLAESVATEFLTDPTKDINSILAEIANRDKLNPIEIQRLVEKSNTLVALKMLQASKDKNIEFDLADYDDVMSAVYDSGKEEPVKEASDKISKGQIPLGFPDARRASRVKDVELYKIAEEVRPEKDIRVRTAFVAKKEYEELYREKIATELILQDAADRLVSEFSKMRGPDFSKFGAEVLAVHGKKAKPLIDGLATTLREPTEFDKLGGVIDDTTFIHAKFAKAHNALIKLVDLNKKMAESQDAVTKAWENLTK